MKRNDQKTGVDNSGSFSDRSSMSDTTGSDTAGEPVGLPREELLSSLIFDGEIVEDFERPSLDSLGRDLSDFKLIRTGMQDWFRSAESEIRRRDPQGNALWSKLEAALEQEAEKLRANSRAAAGARPLSVLEQADRFFGRLFGFSAGRNFSAGPGRRFSWRDYMAYGSSIGAFAVLVLMFLNSSPSSTVPDSATGADPSNSASRESAASAQLAGLERGTAVSVERGTAVSNGRLEVVPSGGSQPLTVVSNAAPAAGGLSSREVEIDKLLQRSRLATVLRTDGADIEWIRSDRGFNLVPSPNGKSPPAIWVARWSAPH